MYRRKNGGFQMIKDYLPTDYRVKVNLSCRSLHRLILVSNRTLPLVTLKETGKRLDFVILDFLGREVHSFSFR
jgi:hypothetical protein